jgi:methylated-DNA-protein-cysteine methyltransferase related protein
MPTTRTTQFGLAQAKHADAQMVASFAQSQKKILAWIRKIPQGNVASYGHIAALAGFPRGARLTARCLRGNTDATLPWWRVVRSDGSCAVPGQLARLVLEGVPTRGQRVRMDQASWQALDLLLFDPDLMD